ncbi:MAG: LysM peptidoglycan-binding domain-containing protein [Bdellovibrionales bacterium]|nr:LysM peptidoglycan-binding domain-containing protein [Bdellovibrionales bacterium]
MTQKRSIVLALFATLFLGACALKPRVELEDHPRITRAESNPEISESLLPKAQISETESSSEIVEENVVRPYKSSYGEVALDQNKHVDMWLRYFTGKGRKHMVRYLGRSSRYLPMMKNTLRENGLPEDLVYIALIESGFSPVAHSHANAVGYWQFIRGTGKRYGLRIDGLIDERRDPVLSTKAAAEYFKTLYGMFGDWHLAMAGYNTGENRVMRAVRRYYTRDFWKLHQQRRSFPRETKNYVPKYIAATMIAKNPKKYGFDDIEYQDPLSYDTVSLKHPISLSRLSQNLRVEVDEMRLLNPKFRGDYVPISRGKETIIRIPVGRANDALAAVPLSVSSAPERVVSNEYFYYRIRRGDNLSQIARRYKTTVSKLRRLNRLSNRSILRIGKRLKVPDPGGAALYANGRGGQIGSKISRVGSSSRPVASVHVVRRGENLSTIARRYGTSVSSLLRLNNLSHRSVIRVGQKIRVRSTSGSANSKGRGYHVVRQGENLTTIAASYGVSVSNLKQWNRLGRSLIYAGQKLVLKNNSPRRASYHIVRRGDNLTEIAAKHRVSVSNLKRWNNLNRSVIYVGQKLKLNPSRSITSASRSNNYHRVRRGETLIGIANRYSVSLSDLASANDISTRRQIRAGRKLIIPN